MKPYTELTRKELLDLQKELQAEYQSEKDKGLKLDISRGKPSKAQLDLSMPMLDVINSSSDMTTENGTDVRNYGLLDGIPEAKKLMGDMMDADPSQVIVWGNSSLNIMYDCVARSVLFGVMGSTPWSKLDKVKFLCPVPGYDRHFGVTEQFGIEMINVPVLADGPDMDMVEEYVNNDPAVKGIWCVPVYANPTGSVYSEETVKRMAALKPAAKDFRIYWDNAYCVHHLFDEEEKQAKVLNILEECERAGNPDMVYQFCSTSKVTFAGAGIAAMSSSPANIADIKSKIQWSTIGPDKINQLRHVRFFKDADGLREHMKKHAAIVRPKFEEVLGTLDRELSELEIAQWSHPMGGYFVSFDAMEGCAKKIVEKCKEAGLVLTGAGAAFPYGKDPKDSNIRIAPTMPPMEELKEAMKLFVTCVKLVTVEKLLEA
ncbi:MAG TPA: aminotransferase class I/II-fold pyridoxal phosphate-dependent enzyme [Candidatus Anaerobutyricum avicola]|nr:aminotransferase class I/II-fold pyridoxal phosphate-dependent enzyme [Candidatus Anaerobutyricum avicola]